MDDLERKLVYEVYRELLTDKDKENDILYGENHTLKQSHKIRNKRGKGKSRQFTKMFTEGLQNLIETEQIDNSLLLLAYKLASYINYDGYVSKGSRELSLKEIAELLHLDYSNFKKQVNQLMNYRMMVKEKRGKHTYLKFTDLFFGKG